MLMSLINIKTVEGKNQRYMSLKLLAVLFLSLPFFINAQSGIIRGKVKETLSGKPLDVVSVQIEGTVIGGVTDSTGAFVITGIQPGLYNLKVSSIGYKSKGVAEIEVTNSRPAILSIELEPDANQLQEVDIKANPFTQKEESPVSVRTIGVNEIQRNPGGNRDISRVIQSLPGVGFSNGFRNDLIIRGGSPEENKFYLDDIEIPNINHFSTQGGSGGPVGLINVDFIREVNFYSSAFPADRGNMLSSLMDVRLRDGRDDRFGLAATLGITDAALS